MSKVFIALTAPALFAIAYSAHASVPSINQSCRDELSKTYEQWRFAPVTQEVVSFAKSRHMDPTAAYGDFDDDGCKDVALLIQTGSKPKDWNPERDDSLIIAVCLTARTKPKLYIIEKPYCNDAIAVSKKGHRYYNYGTDREERYSHDGIAASCFDVAGATYLFSNGSFREVVDSD